MLLLFAAKYSAILALLLLSATGAGTLAVGSREGIAMRAALGMAICAHACFFLAAIGQLRPAPLIVGTVIVIAGGAWRARAIKPVAPGRLALYSAILAPIFVLTLYPPLAFDETLYHLPFVRALARDGTLRFLPNLRVPVFPQFHELLSVPLFLLGGDVAAHLTAFAAVMITAALLIEWGKRNEVESGWLAAALFLGSPLVIHLATVNYVDAALTLFVAAGFYALDRDELPLSGFFFGTACSVKYLGGYFAVAALIIVLAITSGRRRRAAAFVLAGAAAALPTTIWIAITTHDPLFPFLRSNLWSLPGEPGITLSERLVRVARVIWDVTFARGRVGFQPPVTPLLIGIVAVVIVAATRDVRARCMAILAAVYVVIFTFLPQDSRYLVPLLPMLCALAALRITIRWRKAAVVLALLSIAPGIAYASYRLAKLGTPPVHATERDVWLTQRVPAYRALLHAGNERVYVCGGEELKDYARGELLGDFAGPFSYQRILDGPSGTSTVADRLRSIDVTYLLAVTSKCRGFSAEEGMTLVYEDRAARLWRVNPSPPDAVRTRESPLPTVRR